MDRKKPRPVKFPLRKIPSNLIPSYANHVRISHSPSEFTLEFSTLIPGERIFNVNTQIVMSPLGVKLLSKALNENLSRFEKAFGEIKLPEGNSLANQLFKSFNPPEEEES